MAAENRFVGMEELQHGRDGLQLFGRADVPLNGPRDLLFGEHEFDQIFADVLYLQPLILEDPDLPLCQ